MSGYLLDTNVVSLLSPSKGEASPKFLTWLDEAGADGGLFLSAVTVREIERGITLPLERKGATAKARDLRQWMDGIVSTYEDRILPVDAAVSAISGKIEAEAMAAGHNPGMADPLLAETAEAHDLIVVTQNQRHFAPFRIRRMAPPI